MPRSDDIPPVSSKARKIVRELLDVMTCEGISQENINTLVLQVERLGEEEIPAVAEGLDVDDPRKRVVAACFISHAVDQRRKGIRPEWKKQAEQILVHALQKGDTAARFWPCVVLLQGGVPKKAIRVLLEMLEESDIVLQVGAAAALATCGEFAASSIPILRSALQHDNESLAAIAASALARSVGPGKRQAEVVDLLCSALGDVSQKHKYFVIQALIQIGTGARAAVPILKNLLLDTTVPPYLRGEAAIALGAVTQGTEVATPLLLKALTSKEWEIVQGAVEGLVRSGDRPEEAIGLLVNRLASESEDLRRTAARGLRLLCTCETVPIAALFERLGKEPSMSVCEALAEALAVGGAAAIPPAIAIIRGGDLRSVPIASAVLVLIGRDAAEALAETLSIETDASVRFAIVLLLRNFGSKAVPALPVLTRLLDDTQEEEEIVHIVGAIAACGSVARDATAALIRCLVNRGQEGAWWAERVLLHIGREAIPSLEAALQTANDEGKQRLQSVLTGIRGSDDKHFGRYAGLDCDDLLEMFVRVGDVLTTHAPASWKKIRAMLVSRLGPKELKSLRFPTSEASLRTKMAELSGLLKTALTTHKHGYRGGELTPEGRSLLPEIKEHLAVQQRNKEES